MKRTMVCLGIAAALVWTSHAPLPAQDVRLPMRLEDVFSPVFLFVPASNGGSLIAEPGGAVRFLYRTGPGHEGSGGFVYEDTSHDGGESWSLERLSFDTGKGSRSEIAEVHPYTGEIYLMYTRGDGRLMRTFDHRTRWGAETRLPSPGTSSILLVLPSETVSPCRASRAGNLRPSPTPSRSVITPFASRCPSSPASVPRPVNRTSQS